MKLINKFSAEFGISYVGHSLINWDIVNAMSNMIGLALLGSGNGATSFTAAHQAAFQDDLDSVVTWLGTYNVQGVLRSAYLAEMYDRLAEMYDRCDRSDSMEREQVSHTPCPR